MHSKEAFAYSRNTEHIYSVSTDQPAPCRRVTRRNGPEFVTTQRAQVAALLRPRDGRAYREEHSPRRGAMARAINLRSSRSKSLATVRNSYAKLSKAALVSSSLVFCARARHTSAVCRHSFAVIMTAHPSDYLAQKRPPSVGLLVVLPAVPDLLLPPNISYAPAPAYRGSSRRYAHRAYRRSARQTYGAQTPGAPPRMYSGNTAFTPRSGPPPYAAATQSYAANSAQPYEWYAAPGPNRRGNMCVTRVDSLRGYGFQSPCKK
jgi:hypothetical protein